MPDTVRPVMRVDQERLVALLQAMVRTESVNPALDPSGAGEADVAALLADEARALGMEVELVDAGPARTSVIAVLRGTGGWSRSGRRLSASARRGNAAS